MTEGFRELCPVLEQVQLVPGLTHSPWWWPHSNASSVNLCSRNYRLLFIGSLSLGVLSKLKKGKGPPYLDPMPTNCSFLFGFLTMKNINAN